MVLRTEKESEKKLPNTPLQDAKQAKRHGKWKKIIVLCGEVKYGKTDLVITYLDFLE